jgi:hypothetical protein
MELGKRLQPMQGKFPINGLGAHVHSPCLGAVPHRQVDATSLAR